MTSLSGGCHSNEGTPNDAMMNPRIVEALEETKQTQSVTLNLAGNQRLRDVQRLDDRDALILSRCLRENPAVTGVDVRYNDITDDGVRHLAEILKDKRPALLNLDLSFNNIQTLGAQVLATSLECNSSLLALGLSGNRIGDCGAVPLASMLLVNSSLKELELASCDLATESVIAFAIVLEGNTSLLSLDLSRALLFSQQEEWAVHIASMLAVNRCLVELHLGMLALSDRGVERLAEGLSINHSLRYLDLRCNRVTRDGVRHLAQMLMQNPSLEVIDFSSNRIEDDGAVYLSQVIAQPGCALRENSIRTDGLLSLAESMTFNTSLTHLYVWGNQLDEVVCQAFRELISSGRLMPPRTDIRAYEVDGHVFLSEVGHRLRAHYDPPPTGSDVSLVQQEAPLPS